MLRAAYRVASIQGVTTARTRGNGEMVNIVEEYQKQTIELFGVRVKDGKCAFCGKDLNKNEYCDCSEATLVNRFFKKTTEKVNQLKGAFEVRNKCWDEVIKDFRPILPKKFEGMSFGCYRTTNESQKNALRVARKYHQNAIKNYLTGMNLIFFGNYGTGKTMLMSILCEALNRDYMLRCRYVNMVDLMNNIKATFGTKNDKTAKNVLDDYKKAEVLFLDDIDKVKPSEYLSEVFYSITNYRTEHELPTVISANHSLEELEAQIYGEATVSRLADINNAICVNFEHGNFRLEGV